MGLGLHGGGIASARFFSRHGAQVTVTDLRSEEVLAPSLAALEGLPVRFVLGRHEMADFTGADLVVKNPAVPRTSPYLAAAQWVETDISVFLQLNRRPVLAVTGSKGKSTSVSALFEIMKKAFPDPFLGGNITVSPLTFLERCGEASDSPVILELSSWQLADLRPPELLKARIALITNIMADHQNRYDSMYDYVLDKLRILAGQQRDDAALFFYDDEYGKKLAPHAKGRRYFYSAEPLPPDIEGAALAGDEGIARIGGKDELILPRRIRMKGIHNRLNLLAAGFIARLYGVDSPIIVERLADFGGIEHRFEMVAVIDGVTWINDSAATIPEATSAALRSLDGQVHLITGGTDKKLSFELFKTAALLPATIHLLAGTATDRMVEILRQEGRIYRGPFDSLEEAVRSAGEAAEPGDTVLFSPGSTSFGMFLNEFDRGLKFKELVAGMARRENRE
jgi:UDP-N-acetylmuramoylalanine--D-glutamate ligase